jgi:hypothetical protein
LPWPPLNIKRTAQTQEVKLGEQSGERHGNKAREKHSHGCKGETLETHTHTHTLDYPFSYTEDIISGGTRLTYLLYFYLILTDDFLGLLHCLEMNFEMIFS